MLEITYTNSFISGEPGPNLFFLGTPEDYLAFVTNIHLLGKSNGNVIAVENFQGIKLVNCKEIIFKSKKNGNKLIQIDNGIITSELDFLLWEEVIENFFLLSFAANRRVYIEFDNLQLIEEANIIAESISKST